MGKTLVGSPKRLILAALVALASLSLLYIPEAEHEVPALLHSEAFVWGQDRAWKVLEKRFSEAKKNGCTARIGPEIESVRDTLARFAEQSVAPSDPGWAALEDKFFGLIASAGGCPEVLPSVLSLRRDLRTSVKEQSTRWPPRRESRDRLYRLLFGSRIAVEELLLQLPSASAPNLDRGVDEPSRTPSQMIRDVRVHSGDLLLSRGGAATSAFIARGSDYPGNFSHIALVHIDENSGEVSIIESHLESGVGITRVEDYLADKKLRILLLRPRADMPALLKNPMLPHDAARHALTGARSGHIPYDFAMDVTDPSKQFCSEVASSAYLEQGVQLWRESSRFSSPGLARWMADLGVKYLETHGPSDLEYDAQLRVVAEWHDPENLFEDHIDNAVIDGMLAQAEAGASLDYNSALLPLARLTKGFSLLLNAFGKAGPVPEGMSATVSLRAVWLTDTHKELREVVAKKAQTFQEEMGYRAPYFRLFSFSEEAIAETGLLNKY